MKKILVVGGSLQSANMGINALTKGLLNGIYNTSHDDVQVKLLSFVIKKRRIVKFENAAGSYLIEEIPSSVRENLKILLKCFFSGPRGIGKKAGGYTRSPLRHMYSEADLILDLSAGDSFTDIYGIKRYIYTTLPKLIAIKMKKKLILMPQTMGPFEHKIVRSVSRYIVNNCHMNYARDIVSYNYLLKEMKVPGAKAVLAPDLAFNMRPVKEKLIDEVIDPKYRSRAPLVGINISALLLNGGYTSRNQFKLVVDYQSLIDRIIGFFMDRNCTIVLVPHVLCPGDAREDDFSLCRSKAEEIGKYYPHIHTFKKDYVEDQIKAIVGRCDFFIGSRMHACIGAISMGVPTVPVAYSRKFIGIWDVYGMKDCIADAQAMDMEKIMEKIRCCYDNRNKIKEVLGTELKNVKEEISSMFRLIMSC